MITQAPVLKKQKGTNKWYTEYYINEKRDRKTLGESETEKGIQPVFNDFIAKLYIEHHDSPNLSKEVIKDCLLLDDLQIVYESHLLKLERPASLSVFKANFNNFISWIKLKGLEKMKTSQMSVNLLIQYRDYLISEKKKAASTVRRDVGVIKCLLRRLMELSKLNINLDLVRCAMGVSEPKTTYTDKEFEDLVTTNTNEDLDVIIHVIRYAFIRPAEILRIDWEQIDLVNDTITVFGTQSKNKHTRKVKIYPELKEVLEKHKKRGVEKLAGVFTNYCRAYLTKTFNNVRDKAGISSDHKLYGLKHTGVQKLYDQTKDPQLIKFMCGHTNISVTDAYLAREGWG